MRIALIGWGGLVWDSSRLPPGAKWSRGGPTLPLLFQGGPRVHLVVDFEKGRISPTDYVQSHRAVLEDAVEDLRVRDDELGTSVGSVVVMAGGHDEAVNEYDPAVAEAIQAWCVEKGFDAAVWRWRNEPAITFH